MKRFWTGLLAAALCCNALATTDSITSIGETTKQRNIRWAIGLGLLGAEYIGGPILAQSIWWQNGFRWDNPLKFVGEKEPFIADDTWHFAANVIFTESHYQIMSRFLRSNYAVPWACALTFITWTGIESLDALDKEYAWLFSVNDEIANCLGISFWLFKHYFPEVPLHVRVGYRQYSEILNYIKRGLKIFDDYEDYAAQHLDSYGILKVEMIYKFYKDFHAGIAVSKQTGSSKDNLFGLCVGYDFINKLNQAKKGWWNFPVDIFRQYCSLSLGFTLWLD